MDIQDSPERQANREKFSMELELVQALCNPMYLSYLAFQGLLEDEAFIKYLAYLRYWTRPEYARFLHHAYATHILELLQSASFRAALKNEETAAELSRRLLQHWSTWRDTKPTGLAPNNSDPPHPASAPSIPTEQPSSATATS